MSDLLPLPGGDASPEARRALVALAERQMLAPARLAGYELRLVGATVLPQKQTIARTQRGTWLFVNHLEDPTADQYRGRIPIPRDQMLRLATLDRYGVQPQHVWVGHELPPTWKEGDSASPSVPPPSEMREKDEHLRLRLHVLSKLYLRLIGGIIGGAAALPIAAGAALVGGAGLDPIVFGGVQHPELPFVQWAVLAQWTWQ
jgi:hypothetical protein